MQSAVDKSFGGFLPLEGGGKRARTDPHEDCRWGSSPPRYFLRLSPDPGSQSLSFVPSNSGSRANSVMKAAMKRKPGRTSRRGGAAGASARSSAGRVQPTGMASGALHLAIWPVRVWQVGAAMAAGAASITEIKAARTRNAGRNAFLLPVARSYDQNIGRDKALGTPALQRAGG